MTAAAGNVLVDDLGARVPLSGHARRVVSLVPSITEALAMTVPDVLVGATQWCVQPADLDVVRVRGTKNPDLRAICALSPDLVVANQEENRLLDVQRLRAAGIAVWVTRIDSVAEAFTSLGRLFDQAFGLGRVPWLTEAARVWAGPPAIPGLRVAVPIWRDPWTWVGAATYPDDVLTRLGLVNVVAALADRYPRIEPARVLAEAPDVIVLPDEPYPFTAEDGRKDFPGLRSVAISGRALFWYGPAMVSAPRIIRASLR